MKSERHTSNTGCPNPARFAPSDQSRAPASELLYIACMRLSSSVLADHGERHGPRRCSRRWPLSRVWKGGKEGGKTAPFADMVILQLHLLQGVEEVPEHHPPATTRAVKTRAPDLGEGNNGL